MSLRKVKNDITKLKKDIVVDDKPTLINFFNFLEKHYGRKAHYGEITFNSYVVDGVRVKSNPLLFCQLSEQYYTKIHQVKNPVKEELKRWCVTSWVWYHNNGRSAKELEDKTLKEDKEFNARFNTAWNDILEKGDFTKYTELRMIYELRENRVK